MASIISISFPICFILVQLILLNLANCELFASFDNITSDDSLREAGRLKRDLSLSMPFALHMNIQHPKKSITYKLYQSTSYLANKYTPVMTPLFDLNPNVMNDVGEFVVYRNNEKSSAVVYFGKSKTFCGVIGTEYYIENLPYNFEETPQHTVIVGDKYIKKQEQTLLHTIPIQIIPRTSHEDTYENSLPSTSSDPNGGLKRHCDSSDPGPSDKHPRYSRNSHDENYNKTTGPNKYEINPMRKRRENVQPGKYYLETLIFVTRDIARIFKNQYGRENYLEWIVKYYIIYFNAVDMVINKLYIKYASIWVNIAKIVIEDDILPFDFMSNEKLQFDEVCEKVSQYLRTRDNQFTPDSFDYVFISTGRLVTDSSKSTQDSGLTKHDADLYEARKNNKFFEAVPITTIQFKMHYSNFLTASHEIGRLLGMGINPPDKGIKSTLEQCYGIMQEKGPKCNKCLVWCRESRDEIELFLSQNRNRCNLLNEPRSIRPPGASDLVSVTRQCKCYGHNVIMTNVRKRECTKPLQCILYGKCKSIDVFTDVRPFDGTICDKEKVCWGGECVPIVKHHK